MWMFRLASNPICPFIRIFELLVYAINIFYECRRKFAWGIAKFILFVGFKNELLTTWPLSSIVPSIYSISKAYAFESKEKRNFFLPVTFTVAEQTVTRLPCECQLMSEGDRRDGIFWLVALDAQIVALYFDTVPLRSPRIVVIRHFSRHGGYSTFFVVNNLLSVCFCP